MSCRFLGLQVKLKGVLMPDLPPEKQPLSRINTSSWAACLDLSGNLGMPLEKIMLAVLYFFNLWQ